MGKLKAILGESGTIIGEEPEEFSRRVMVERELTSMGRPTKLNEDLVDALCALIMRGNPPANAAGTLGLGRSTYLAWMAKGQKQSKGKFRDFRDRIETACCKGQSYLISIVREGAIMDPGLALQMLSRLNRPDWAAQLNVETKHSGTVEHEHRHDHEEAREIIEDSEASIIAHELLVRVRTRKRLRISGGTRELPIPRGLGASESSGVALDGAGRVGAKGNQAAARPDAAETREE